MGFSILIVEDEQLVALDIQRRLTQLGHQVVAICDRAETALEAAENFHPELILMDIHLKGDTDGIAIAARIRERYQLPIIFLTAHADDATVAQAKATHPFGYLIKPVQTKHLNTALEIAVSWHQAEMMMQKALAKERDLSEALQRALIKEKQLNELKSQFVSIVSHEFRNPLSSIMATLSLLERQDLQLTVEQRLAYLKQAKGTTGSLLELFEDVLTLSDTETSQFYCHPVPMDVLWFCRELVHEYQTQATTHALHFEVEGCDKASPLFYNLDPKLLRHILCNLLSNAIKYSPEGGTIDFQLNCAMETLNFCIQDQGIGILPEEQSRLFEPFCRGSNVKKISGTGLGLFIVKKCVEAHGGEITVHSTVGRGTTFTVTLPIHCCASS
ncbi:MULTISPECIES: ATP-binding protein [unclassified Leptolyngbya]|uniref:hybrid sensor histidine kinase/response regulator n=1 Tax=unclassified Leptolyngbya TaxID=2650499 RepID=UPI001687CE7D|nr:MULTISPECIES: ATP-binding protein [unclassified Leptolyngbya]MBD1909681.1 response regulator [Leptolyngbya sp. FACHB-8]MBD2157542.1 response regulator [Leptolyngbya sp. FACHB-16]